MLRLIVAACLLALSAGAQEPSPSDFEIEAAYCLGADSVLLRMINPGQMDCGNGAPKSCTEIGSPLHALTPASIRGLEELRACSF